MTQTTDLEQFHQYVSDRLTRGERQLTPEEALERFRTEMAADADLKDSVAAIRRALEQADQGLGLPLDEAMRRLRAEFELPEATVKE